MISIAQIRDTAAAVILERHPELVGAVTFDAHVPAICCGMHMIELRIISHDNQKLWPIAREVVNSPFAPPRQWPLGIILDHYCNNEPDGNADFELAGLRWLIGDGDDTLALSEISSDTVVLWVRCWED